MYLVCVVRLLLLLFKKIFFSKSPKIKLQNYPALFVSAARNDPRVNYWVCVIDIFIRNRVMTLASIIGYVFLLEIGLFVSFVRKDWVDCRVCRVVNLLALSEPFLYVSWVYLVIKIVIRNKVVCERCSM